jgi:hypothetical protein
VVFQRELENFNSGDPVNQCEALYKKSCFFVLQITMAGLLLLAIAAQGQEALRISLASDTAEEVQRQEENTIGYYNLLLGPLAWRFSSGLELEYDDNILLQDQDPQGDFISRPNLNAQLHWPITLKNSLDFSFSAGYSIYAIHSDLDQFFINPGSGLSFNIYAGNCVINLHDWISITENGYQNPTVGQTGNYAQLQNTIGAKSLWDLNKLMAEIGYDHEGNISLADSQAVPDSTSENFYMKAGARPVPELTVGLEGGVSQINFSDQQIIQPNAYQWNAGGFCQGQVSQYIIAELDAGYTTYVPENTVGLMNLTSIANLYFQLSLSHRVDKYFDYTLTAGRSTSTAFYGQPYDYYFVNWQPNWNLFKNYQLSTPIWWQKGTELYALGGQGLNYEQYGVGINISRTITQKLSGQLGYQFIRENSGQQGPNYTVNILSLSFSYQF